MRKIINELLKENCEFKRKEAQSELYNSLLIKFMEIAHIVRGKTYTQNLPLNGIRYKITVEEIKEDLECEKEDTKEKS